MGSPEFSSIDQKNLLFTFLSVPSFGTAKGVKNEYLLTVFLQFILDYASKE
jgi:hypothetical protein